MPHVKKTDPIAKKDQFFYFFFIALRAYTDRPLVEAFIIVLTLLQNGFAMDWKTFSHDFQFKAFGCSQALLRCGDRLTMQWLNAFCHVFTLTNESAPVKKSEQKSPVWYRNRCETKKKRFYWIIKTLSHCCGNGDLKITLANFPSLLFFVQHRCLFFCLRQFSKCAFQSHETVASFPT